MRNSSTVVVRAFQWRHRNIILGLWDRHHVGSSGAHLECLKRGPDENLPGELSPIGVLAVSASTAGTRVPTIEIDSGPNARTLSLVLNFPGRTIRAWRTIVRSIPRSSFSVVFSSLNLGVGSVFSISILFGRVETLENCSFSHSAKIDRSELKTLGCVPTGPACPFEIGETNFALHTRPSG